MTAFVFSLLVVVVIFAGAVALVVNAIAGADSRDLSESEFENIKSSKIKKSK